MSFSPNLLTPHTERQFTIETISPDEYRLSQKDFPVFFAVHDSPFGECLIAMTRGGICAVSFLKECGRDNAVSTLRKNWSRSKIHEDPLRTEACFNQIFGDSERQRPLRLFLKGTHFQLKVWKSLLEIPYGEVRCYEEVAKSVGDSRAVRAVANSLKIIAFPSITGNAALAPRFPSPRIAEPSLTTATLLLLTVNAYARDGSS